MYFTNFKNLLKQYDILEENVLIFDYQNKNLVFNSAPANGSKINFITMGNNGEAILDVDIFNGDGSTTEFITRGQFKANTISTLVKVNGVNATHTIFETDSTYSKPNKVGIRFATAPSQDAVINICVYERHFSIHFLFARHVRKQEH